MKVDAKYLTHSLESQAVVTEMGPSVDFLKISRRSPGEEVDSRAPRNLKKVYQRTSYCDRQWHCCSRGSLADPVLATQL